FALVQNTVWNAIKDKCSRLFAFHEFCNRGQIGLQFTPRQPKSTAKISSFLWKPAKEERQLSARLELRSVKWLNPEHSGEHDLTAQGGQRRTDGDHRRPVFIQNVMPALGLERRRFNRTPPKHVFNVKFAMQVEFGSLGQQLGQ